MQAIEYEISQVDLLFRKQIEKKLLAIAGERGTDKLAFNCMEFGFCVLTVNYLQDGTLFEFNPYGFHWFKPANARIAKPRIAVTVTATEGYKLEEALRDRWQFAMSHLGFLYPVAYYQHEWAGSGWKEVISYKAWVKNNLPFNQILAKAPNVVPDDAICRTAERMFAARAKAKAKKK